MKEKVPSVCSQRWILAYIFCTGTFCAYAMRVNISVALVCMVKTPVNESTLLMSVLENRTVRDDECGELEVQNLKTNQRGEFDWDKNRQSSILAAFFYGYIITQIPGGWLADRFGGRHIYGVAMAISAICTVLTPVCARTSVYLVYVLRVLIGLAAGCTRPATYSMLGRWSPCLERSKLSAIAQVGSILGVIGTFSLSGVLCEYGFDNGWGSIFYITGGISCIWVIVWYIQVRDSPAEHPRITQAEKDYIINNIEFDTTKRSEKIPWKAMALSVPLWATFVCHMCGNWAEFTLITSLPAFMKGVLKFDIKSNGALSGVPYLCASIMSIIAGHLADYVRSKHILTTTHTRKVFQSIAYIGAGIFLVATGFVPCSMRELAVVFLCIAVLSTGFMSGGYYANHIDLAPKYAGLLYGVSNSLATIPGLISPIVAGALTPNDLPHEWRNVFYVGAAFYALGTIFYDIFGSGEIQPWAKDKTTAEITVEVKLLPLNGDKISSDLTNDKKSNGVTSIEDNISMVDEKLLPLNGDQKSNDKNVAL